jgi:tRNA U34 5-methylaminomethyl-2-thiouridine-forming methyltransferase MnmC
MTPLILKRAPIGDNQDDYDVLENGVVVGRIFFLDAVGPQGRPWMWASGHAAGTVARARHGYEPTREAAMAAFAKSSCGRRRVL